MIPAPLRRAVLFAVILTTAMASAVSAARLAPERTDPDVAAYLAVGGSLDDLCGDGSSHEAHHCPFCRLLNEPPAIGIAPRVRRATPALAWRDLGHLIARSQAGTPHFSARAPPAPV